MLCFIRDTGAYFPSLVRRIKRCRTHTSSDTLNSSALVNTTSRIRNQSKSTKPRIFLSVKYFEWDVFTFFFLQSQLLLCRILEAAISDVSSHSASPPPSPKDHDLDLETRFETEAAFEQEHDEVSIVSGGSSSTLGSTPPKIDLKYVMCMRVHSPRIPLWAPDHTYLLWVHQLRFRRYALLHSFSTQEICAPEKVKHTSWQDSREYEQQN